MSFRRKSCRRNPLGPMRVNVDLITLFKSMGIDVRVDPMDKPIEIGQVTPQPMKQPESKIFFMDFRYGRTKL